MIGNQVATRSGRISAGSDVWKSNSRGPGGGPVGVSLARDVAVHAALRPNQTFSCWFGGHVMPCNEDKGKEK